MPDAEQKTVLGLDTGGRVFVLGVSVLGCVAVGFAFPRVAQWAQEQQWVPFKGPVTLISDLTNAWPLAVWLIIAAVVGLIITFLIVASTVKVELTREEVTVKTQRGSRTYPAAEIGAVFSEGKLLVALDKQSRYLFVEEAEASADEAAEAFTAHGYPWRATDPFADQFRRWVPATPELPEAVSAVLAARETALKKKEADDIRDLRDEVHRLGYAVRDDGTRQFWRPLIDITSL